MEVSFIAFFGENIRKVKYRLSRRKEGPVIQGANLRALSGGVTTDKVFAMVEEIRKSCETPLVFMTYANVVFSYGTERFMKQASEAGMNIAKDKYHWEKKLHNFSKTMGSNRKNDAVYSWQKEDMEGYAMKKKYFLCLLTVAMLLGGCGNTASSEDTTSQTPEKSDASVVSESQNTSLPPVSTVQPTESSTVKDTTADDAMTAPVDASTWELIQQYGFEDMQDKWSQVGQRSDLSYRLKTDTLKDEGEYYTIETEISKKVEIPADLKTGDTVTITRNELTGETDELTMGENNMLTGKEGNEYYFFNDSVEDGKVTLYEDSDDRVDAPFATGTLCISKDATTGAYVEQKPYETISKSVFDDDPWFNGVYFNDDGAVVQLIFYGD